MPVSLSPLDITIFLGSLIVVMAVGLWTGREEETAEDFFLAGKTVPWWGVAGSIFGTNVSAEHLVGMLGIGYSIGFAQSHFEYGAIFALLILCFVFLPLYRKMGVYTLSEYLGRRYDERSRALYSALNIVTMVVVRMTLGFYIGARALRFLLEGTPLETSYVSGVLIFAVVTSAYTVFGGLKAVIWTDVMQSALLLLAGLFVALLVFDQPEIGGFFGLLALDSAQPEGLQKFHLYLPTDHPQLPWSGVVFGLMIIHTFYWATNQFIVQRALAARSDFDAKLGIIAAGYLKLLIPFVSISAGIAAAHVFQARVEQGAIAQLPLPDDAFPLLVKLIVPTGYGLVGLITAGLIGAILSSIDSMMNSGATLFTFDFYKRFIRPDAGDDRLIFIGRLTIVVFVLISAVLACVIYTENEGDNFFLKVPAQIGHVIPGIAAAFLLGVFWRGAGAAGAFWAMLLGPLFSFAIEASYGFWAPDALQAVFGANLNFLHRTALTTLFCVCVMVLLRTPARAELQSLMWSFEASCPSGRDFWRSERPWAWLLAALTCFMLIYFA